MEKKFITKNTKININEEVFKIKAKEVICELFVDYVNNVYGTSVVELRR